MGAENAVHEQAVHVRLDALEKRMDRHEEAEAEALREIREELRAIREDLSRRLPVWVTFLLTACAGTIASLVTALVGK